MISQETIDAAWNTGLTKIGDRIYQRLENTFYGLYRPCPDNTECIYLFITALSTWDNTPGAKNYFDESTLMSLISKINTI